MPRIDALRYWLISASFHQSPVLQACLLLGLAQVVSGLTYAQAPLATNGQKATLSASSAATDVLPVTPTPAPQPDAFAAWNALLQDVARIGIRAASQNGVGSGSPMDAPMPGETNGLTQTRSASSDGEPGTHTGFGHGSGMHRPMGGDPMRTNGPGTMQAGNNMSRGMGGGPRGAGSLNVGSLFQLAGDAGHGLTAGGYTGLGSALGVLPTISQFTRSGLSLPVASSIGNFRLSYQSPLTLPGMNGSTFAMHGYGSGFAAYDSPHARSGRVDFSASATMGMGSSGSAGGMSGGGGGMGHGGPGNHNGPSNQPQPAASVSLHLSF